MNSTTILGNGLIVYDRRLFLIVISLEHAQPRVVGYLKRHLTEIRPGVLIGNATISRREQLWEHIIKEDPTADIVMAYSVGKKICYKSIGNPTRFVQDFDGLSILSYSLKEIPLYTRLLAKPTKTVLQHCLEVGITSEILLRESIFVSTLEEIKKLTSISESELISSICFLCSVHDIGKATPLFQKKIDNSLIIDEIATLSYAGYVRDGAEKGFRHEAYSDWVLRKWLREKGIDRKESRRYGNLVCSHHQGNTKGLRGSAEYGFETGQDEWNENIVFPLINDIEKEYPFTPFKDIKEPDVLFSLILGLLIASDWIASGHLYDDCKDKESTVKIAKEHIYESGILEWIPEQSYDYNRLFPSLKELRPLQKELINILSIHNHFDCMLIEAPMGMGKTEAGLYTLMNVARIYNKTGLYIAMPTAATAEAMLSRIENMQSSAGLYPDTEIRELAGISWMNIDNESIADRSSWLKHGPMKLFSKLAVGTVDQIMAAAQSVKYGDLLKIALSTKCVLIDEIHAYDSYMLKTIKVLLTWLRAMHVPVVMLSATLPERTKKDIIQDVYGINEYEPCNGYPCITTIQDKNIEQKCIPSKDITVKHIETLRLSEQDVINEALNSVADGGCTCIFVNTVKRAQYMYKELNSVVSSDVKTVLFTARTTPKYKEEKSREIIEMVGKDRTNRPLKLIVVSTQIMEASMDVDFDTIISHISPMDSVLQRLGRWCRHSDYGTVRMNKSYKSRFIVIIPDEYNTNSSLPYPTGLLRATEKTLQRYPEFEYPVDIPIMVNEVYSNMDDSWSESEREEWEMSEYGKAAKASMYTIEKPRDDYNGYDYTPLLTSAYTRDIEMETRTIMIVPDDVYTRIKAKNDFTKKDCIGLLKSFSVSVPRYDIEKYKKNNNEYIEEDLPIWLSDTFVVPESNGYFKVSKDYDYEAG